MSRNHRLLFASDHAGFELKQSMISFYSSSEAFPFDIVDFGCSSSNSSVDYPDFAHLLVSSLSVKDFGVLICGSGIGMSIYANRFPHIRAALCYSVELAKLSRMHNDSNVLCLGARFLNVDDTTKIVDAFLNTDFEGGRHLSRVNKLSSVRIESNRK